MKQCKNCLVIQLLDNFGKCSNSKDGLLSWCKDCNKIRKAKYHIKNKEKNNKKSKEYYLKNKSIINKKRREQYKNDPSIKNNIYLWRKNNNNKIKQIRKKYYKKYKEIILAKHKKYVQDNKRSVRAREALWHKLHPENKRAKMARRRAREKNAPGLCSKDQLKARWDYYGGKCWMCGKDANTVEHVIPLSKGGSNWPANLRPACKMCNSKKSDKNWRKYICC